MPRDILVRQVMTTDVVSFSPDESIQEAMGRLVEREVDGGPVVDNGKVVGMLTAGDLIVQDARLHGPTVITLLGATIDISLDQTPHRLLDRLVRAERDDVGGHHLADQGVAGHQASIRSFRTGGR